MTYRRIVLILSIAVRAGSSYADPIGDATRDFEDGLKLYRAGAFDLARAAFARARDRAPDKPNPYRYLGLVDAKLGHCADAVRNIDAFLGRLKKIPEHDDRIVELNAARARCSGTLVVESSPMEAEVRLDTATGPPLGTTPFKKDHLPIGPHLVLLAAKGYEPLSKEIAIAGGETLRLAVVLQVLAPPKIEAPAAALPRPPAPLSEGAVSVVAPPALPEKEVRRPRYWILGVVAGTAAIAAVGIGVGVGLSRPTITQLPDVKP